MWKSIIRALTQCLFVNNEIEYCDVSATIFTGFSPMQLFSIPKSEKNRQDSFNIKEIKTGQLKDLSFRSPSEETNRVLLTKQKYFNKDELLVISLSNLVFHIKFSSVRINPPRTNCIFQTYSSALKKNR